MYCQACGSEVSEDYGFCPVCGATLEHDDRPQTQEAATRRPFGLVHAGAILLGVAAGFAISYSFGWTLFLFIPVLFIGGQGEIGRLVGYAAVGMLAGLCVGALLRASGALLWRRRAMIVG